MLINLGDFNGHMALKSSKPFKKLATTNINDIDSV